MSSNQHSDGTWPSSASLSDVLPAWAIGALLYRFDVAINRVPLTPALDFGMFDLPEKKPTGFLWPYHLRGHSCTDSPDVILALSGFKAPMKWCEQLLEGAQVRVWDEIGAGETVLPFKQIPAGVTVSIFMPTQTDGSGFEKLVPWFDRFGRQFLLMGGIHEAAVAVGIHIEEFSHPLSWQSPA